MAILLSDLVLGNPITRSKTDVNELGRGTHDVTFTTIVVLRVGLVTNLNVVANVETGLVRVAGRR